MPSLSSNYCSATATSSKCSGRKAFPCVHCYVWSSKEHPETIITNPYSDRAKEILLRKGAGLVGAWQEERVNILDGYEKAFGSKPPERARIAVMNDSDNTGESSVSRVDYIEVSR